LTVRDAANARSASTCFRQAGHQDAQTVTTTGRPSSFPSPTTAPVVTSVPVKRTSGPLRGSLVPVSAVSTAR